MTLCTISNR